MSKESSRIFPPQQMKSQKAHLHLPSVLSISRLRKNKKHGSMYCHACTVMQHARRGETCTPYTPQYCILSMLIFVPVPRHLAYSTRNSTVKSVVHSLYYYTRLPIRFVVSCFDAIIYEYTVTGEGENAETNGRGVHRGNHILPQSQKQNAHASCALLLVSVRIVP